MANPKIPLPEYLKALTTHGLSMQKAMQISGQIYKTFNTPAQLSELSQLKLKACGIDDKDDRKMIMSAIRKAGYISDSQQEAGSSDQPTTTVEKLSTPTKKRKHEAKDVNEFLPDGPTDEAAKYGSLDFNEVLDINVLLKKSTIINRAPLMTAWAMIVSERLGFRREEALSIASVYTEMNALSKGVSLGIYQDGKQKGLDAIKGGSQPYVELMGRRMYVLLPLYQSQSNQWRALLNGKPAQPSYPFSYISRSFRQTTPHIIGALRLLAESFAPKELNNKGWALYAEFRPSVNGWGERSEVKCETILSLRNTAVKPAETTGASKEVLSSLDIVQFEECASSSGIQAPKRQRISDN
ncbi:uncharacterized protein BT62DRAFT_1002659 [Guyanagaster necrorhizus]|uniref:Uncharacterized protein n=1 Tax=Guyanagaster necrorhizus TaxID=856835 RepID=A0A9P7VY91_9AGAR|nr:uncharacterized protein BT62DRAFT_1002659 [Guyanagaster necrorhizus MCA 3950]KAG7449117.1 hypothetical protein BT62DRAFT_1002659 [Guyanagaster necrorhizus MCA 3950]